MLIDHERDWRNKAKVWKREGLAEGLSEGLAEGLSEGLAEGLMKGQKKGRIEGRIEGERSKELAFVETLIRDTDFDDQKIAALAAAEERFVRKIRAELKAV